MLSRWWFAVAALASPIIRGRQAETAVSVKRYTHWLRSQMQFDMCPSSAERKKGSKGRTTGEEEEKKKGYLTEHVPWEIYFGTCTSHWRRYSNWRVGPYEHLAAQSVHR